MLALLPLLLAQQEAGAGIFASSVSGNDGYNALFNVQGNKVVISITFGKNLDLAPAKDLEQVNFGNPNARLPIGNVEDESVMRFYITDDTGTPTLNIIQLLYDPIANPINLKLGTINLDPIPQFTIDPGRPTTLTATYTKSGGDLNIGNWGYTCMLLDTNLRPTPPEDGCATGGEGDYPYLAQLNPEEVSSIPLPNSFMLLGIGLMALGIPRRRGRLF